MRRWLTGRRPDPQGSALSSLVPDVPPTTPDGRPVRVVLLGRDGCHLCREAEPLVAEVCADLGVGWVHRDVDASAVTRARWSDDVPVVLVDGAVVARWRVDPQRLRVALTRRR